MFVPLSCSELRSVMERLEEALGLLRRALQIIDECEDPFEVGPHVDLAIAKLSGSMGGSPGNDNPDKKRGRLIY
jgi:hypothetical protein